MTVNQVSVFLENRSGTLLDLTELFAAHGFNMRALSIADTSDFGVVRIIVDNADAEKVVAMLRENHYIAQVVPVLALEISDEAGILRRILGLLQKSGQNIEYMYGVMERKTNNAYMIIRTADVHAAEKALENAGIKLADGEEIGSV